MEYTFPSLHIFTAESFKCSIKNYFVYYQRGSPKFRFKYENGESGDPHFTTFDGLSYEFHGPCTYKLFQDCTDKPRFAVHTEHISALGPGHNKTYVYVVWVMLPHTVIELQNTDVKVNGKSVLPMLPITVDTDVEIGLNKPKNKIVVTKPGMFSINWNGNGAIRARLDKAWYGRVCGLLGDGDGESGNDMKMLLSDGTLQLTDDINEFGYSWEVPQSCNKINTAK
ncbi:BMP-binding endothelial regulator protein-like [Saccoglossus kowalevskii]